MSEDRFISYLRHLGKEERGVLAAYRRGCGQRLIESKGCQAFAAVSARPVDFLTVSLVAQYSSEHIERGTHNTVHARKGSIGAAWAVYCRARGKEYDPAPFYRKRQEDLASGKPTSNVPAIHERFRMTLDAGLSLDATGELTHRLCGLIRMLVAEDVPIDVIQLAHDLRGWRAESRFVQERWAMSFYAPPFEEPTTCSAERVEQDEDERPPRDQEEEHEDAD